MKSSLFGPLTLITVSDICFRKVAPYELILVYEAITVAAICDDRHDIYMIRWGDCTLILWSPLYSHLVCTGILYWRPRWREREGEERDRKGAEKERVSGDCGGRSRAVVGHLERDGTAERRETAGGERDGPRPRRKDWGKEGKEKGKRGKDR